MKRGRSARVLSAAALASGGAALIGGASSTAAPAGEHHQLLDSRLASESSVLPLHPGERLSERQAIAAGVIGLTETPMSGGGTLYTYTSASDPGSSVEVPLPAAGFQPLTASAAQLAEYGFPPEPLTPGDAQSEWRQAMSDYRSRSVPDFSVTVDPPGFGTGPTFDPWSGWAAENTTGGTDWKFIALQGTVPRPQ